jgi:hypothetical protein
MIPKILLNTLMMGHIASVIIVKIRIAEIMITINIIAET